MSSMTTMKMSTVTLIILLFLILFGVVLSIGNNDENIVQLDQGSVMGSVLKSRNGREFKAFFGIPYAKPPIGDLRFKDPVPADAWNDVIKPTTEAQNVMCIQKDLFSYRTADELLGTEDCLYINVYTKKLPTKQDGELLPVMVWIAGGGFLGSGGSITVFGPHYLMDKDVVVVTFNYRLGILGFLSTEDEHLPGNYGMKDQVLALKWVQKNIKAFGGDPDRVTIFGESAGSVSVGLHLLSRMSKGLFHKAIMESSSPVNLWGVTPPGLAKKRAMSVLTITGCPDDNPEEMVECLRQLPADVLVNICTDFFEWKTNPLIIFSPVVESSNLRNGEHEQFLTKYPPLEFEQESNVPVIIGHNSGEGAMAVSRMYGENGLVYTELKENFNHYFSSMIQYRYTTKWSDIQRIGEAVFQRYFIDRTMGDVKQAVKAVTGIFIHDVFDMAVKLQQSPYYYVYDHLNKKSTNSLFGPYPCPRYLGVTHADDLISLFYSPKVFGDLEGDDLKVSKLMVNLWTRFASADNLTIDGTDEGQMWPMFEKTSYKYIRINSSNLFISERPYVEEYEFWKNLPLFSGISTKDPKC